MFENARVAFESHDLLFIPPFAPHAFVSAPGAGAHLAVHFDFAPDTPPDRDPDQRLPYEIRLTHGCIMPVKTPLAAGHRVAHAFGELLREQAGGDALGALAAANLLSTILIDLSRESARTHAGRGDGAV